MAGLALRGASLRALAGLTLALSSAAYGQTWTHLVHNPPQAVNLMLLLSDGTVMASRNNGTSTISSGWYRLTPDSHGSYINGTWTTLASMHDNRLYYSSAVLRDGRVFVAGGEYGMGGPRAEIYDPQTNVWTQLTVPLTILNPNMNSPVTGGPQTFYDSNCEVLPDGSIMIMPVQPLLSGIPVIYNPATNTWSNGPHLFRGSYQDEASWVKLPDDTILTIDPFGTNSERYYPTGNIWINDGIVPVSLYDPFGFELGGAFLLPTGKAFYLGSTGHTALYTPTGTTAPGVWTAGPDIPGAHGTPDAPAAMMVNGKILCAVSPIPTSSNHFPSPTTFYEYDPFAPPASAFTAVSAPAGANDPIPTYKAAMLDLPNGQVLYSHMGVDVYAYQPVGAPLAMGKPIVQTVSQNADGSYHLTGLGLNGISEGACYGDDFQMNSNYPLVRLTDAATNVFYARTYNWSSTGVMTGSRVVSVEYRLPTGLPAVPYTAVVVANGIASDPFDPACMTAQVTAQPAPRTVCAGGSMSMSVTATGTSIAYQWQHNGTPLTNGGGGGSISGADTATLAINPVVLADKGSYTCTVSNACGNSTSSAALLTVNSADFNSDGDIGTDGDIEAFFACLAGNCCVQCGSADFNGDGDVGTDADIEAFFRVLGGGAC
jgi:hypothetical protein